MALDIRGVAGIPPEQIQQEVERGAKFVVFQYCVSVLVMTFRRSSTIYFVRSGENAVAKGAGWTVLTFFAGWWGFPWGLIYTPMVLFKNLSGGKDVTPHLLPLLTQPSQSPGTTSPGVWPPAPGALSSKQPWEQ